MDRDDIIFGAALTCLIFVSVFGIYSLQRKHELDVKKLELIKEHCPLKVYEV